jgi:A/G-specific adenine glycosylase
MKPDFTRQLLRWNKQKNTRLMPWKGEKDPYKIWLSEIILQQTRVEQGWSYYEKFIKAFPKITDLAKAKEKTVFKMWEGLGYYTRCKNLIATAKKITKDFKGKFPTTYEEIKKLKGIGPYTAAAVSSFAFNEPQAVVDGNVQRVLSRYFGISTPIDTTHGKKMYQQLAQALLDNEQPGTYNQAIMDFGAVICKPQNPLCQSCVQKKECLAFKLNMVNLLPVKEKNLIKKERRFYYFIIEYQNKLYIRKRTAKDIWENLYEFFLYEAPIPQEEEPAFPHLLKELLGTSSFTIEVISKEFRQQLTHQKISGRFITVRLKKPCDRLENFEWVEKKALKRFAFPRFINTYLSATSL